MSENFAGFGPKEINQVPNEKPVLNAEGYQKLPVADALSNTFSQIEHENLLEVSKARSLPELRERITAFNNSATPKAASELGLSLADMEISGERIALGEIHDFQDAHVELRRAKDGMMSLHIIDDSISRS